MNIQNDLILLPCPFCGVIPELERVQGQRHDPNGSEFWGVICRSQKNVGSACEVNIPPRRAKDSAVKAWNTRSVQAPPQPIYDEAKERELFEAFQVDEGGNIDFEDGYYDNVFVQSAWDGWKACAQSRAKAGEVGYVEG